MRMGGLPTLRSMARSSAGLSAVRSTEDADLSCCLVVLPFLRWRLRLLAMRLHVAEPSCPNSCNNTKKEENGRRETTK